MQTAMLARCFVIICIQLAGLTCAGKIFKVLRKNICSMFYLHQRVRDEDNVHPVEDRGEHAVPEPHIPLEVQHTHLEISKHIFFIHLFVSLRN